MNDIPPTDPSQYSGVTYLWVFFLSTFGGVASFFNKLKQGHARPFNFTEFIGEIVVSAFAGLITFYICEAAHVDRVLCAAFVGVSGHMGSRAIFLFEKWALAKWGANDVKK